MRLDLRRPLLVVVGAWNPAIFNLNWMGLNLFGLKEGEETSIMQFFSEGRAPASYFGNLGIGISQNRLDLYSNSFSADSRRALENLCIKILDLLPHTPMTGIGVNFIFEETAPDAQLVDKLRTHEGIAALFQIEEQTFITRIKLDNIRLNLRREVSAARLSFDFNFHHALNGAEAIKELLPNCIDRLHDRAVDIHTQLYGEHEIEVTGHTFPGEDATGDKQ